MSYQKNHLLNHEQSNFTIFFAKNHIFYLVCSCVFWLIVTAISWIQFYDPKLGNTLSVYKIDSVFFIFHLILYFIFIVGICLTVGAILSLPAILGKSILEYIILKERKKYKRVFYLVFFAQYTPYVMLLLSNGLFYYANISTKIHNNFLYSYKLEKINKNYTQIGRQNPNAYYIFFIPDYLIENNEKLTKTKSLLPYNDKLFLESHSKPEIIALLMQQEHENVVEYYAPAPLKNEAQFTIPARALSIGMDRKNTPEFLNLYSKNILEGNKFRITKSTLLSNRAIASLKPIQMVLKSNILGLISANWTWENYGNSSLDILTKHSSQLKRNTPSEYNVLFISDLEMNSTKSLFIGSSDFMDQKDLLIAEQNLDKNLFVTIHALRSSGAKNIVLLPYQVKANSLAVSLYYTTIKNDGDFKSYRTFFKKNEIPFFCKTQFLPNLDEASILNQTLLIDNLKFSAKGTPYLKPEYGFYIKKFFENTLFCYEQKKNVYILKMNNMQNNIDHFKDNIERISDLDIYNINNKNNMSHLLTKEEKNIFISKYKYEIFKQN